MINLFFPLAFFLLILCFVGVVLAFLLLDNAGPLVLTTQRVLGVWFALFGIVFAGSLLLLIGLVLTGNITLTSSPTDLLAILGLLLWNIAFAVISAIGAYSLLFLWSTSVRVDASSVVRELAFGKDVIARSQIDKVVEVIYLYIISNDPIELRPKSFFVLVCHDRNRFLRYALFRPTNRFAEDEFRETIKDLAPLALTTVPGLPKLPRISFHKPWMGHDK